MSSIGTGISYSINGVLQALSNLSTTVVGTVTNTIASQVGPYRPAKWSQPPVTSITVPGTPGSSGTIFGQGSSSSVGQFAVPNNAGIPTISVATAAPSVVSGTPDQVLVFDAVFNLEHEQGATPTSYPVQSGANGSDHIYIKQAVLTMRIGISDCMQSYTIGQWSGSATKSVNAYQTLLGLMFARTPLTVTTKLRTYTQIFVTNIHAPDNFETINSLRATITFTQLFIAQVSSTNINSARTDATGSTNEGVVPTLPVPGVVTDNYSVPAAAPATPVVLGAGDFSSNPTGS